MVEPYLGRHGAGSILLWRRRQVVLHSIFAGASVPHPVALRHTWGLQDGHGEFRHVLVPVHGEWLAAILSISEYF